MSVFREIASHVPADTGKTLLETPDGFTLSYAEMLAATARLARLLSDLGLVPGDRIAVQVEKSANGFLVYLAAQRAGLIYLPLNTAYTDDELDYLIGDAEPALVLCDPKRKDGLKPICARHAVRHLMTLDATGQGALFDEAAEREPTFEPVPRDRSDIAAILYTSGTTGKPKGAMLTQDNLISNAEVLVRAWRFTEADVLLHALPLFHTHGLFVAGHCVLFAAGSMILLPKFDPDAVFSHLPRATAFMGVPTFYTRLLADDRLNRTAVRNMRLFTAGSAPLLAETHTEFEARTGHKILERYGMTETMMSCSNLYDGDRRPGSVGPPLETVEVRVVGDDGAPLPVGEVGMLQQRGRNVFAGYWRNPEKTKEDFTADGWFVTGDLAKIAPDGYVTIVGREKDLVITGGFNVYPKEVEEVIDSFDEVKETAVIGVPHPDFGEGVVAIAVPEPGCKIDPATIIARCKEKLANYKVPKAVLETDSLPRNTMGKVQKKELRQIHDALFRQKAG